MFNKNTKKDISNLYNELVNEIIKKIKISNGKIVIATNDDLNQFKPNFCDKNLLNYLVNELHLTSLYTENPNETAYILYNSEASISVSQIKLASKHGKLVELELNRNKASEINIISTFRNPSQCETQITRGKVSDIDVFESFELCWATMKDIRNHSHKPQNIKLSIFDWQS